MRSPYPIVAGLLVLAAIPVAAGAFRVSQLAAGAEITASNARFFADPVPVVVHIVAVTVFSILGAFQFVPGLRARAWHRTAGRVLVVCGLATSLSGLWLTLFYPHPETVGWLLTAIRLVVGTAMTLAIVLGFAAARRRDFTTHRGWMIRGYALGMGAGTQAFTLGTWSLAVGQPDRLANALLHLAGWLINLAVAEWVIRRNR